MSDTTYLLSDLDSDHLKIKAVKSGGMMISSRLIGTIIQFASAIILARLLTPRDFGLVAMVTVFTLLLYNVGLNGFSEAIIQAKKLTQQQVSSLFWIGLFISTILTILFLLIAPLLAKFYREKEVLPIAQALSISFIFSALATEHLALIMRNLEFHKIFLIELTAGILSTSIAIIMAFTGFGYWAIVARQLTIPVISTSMAWILCKWRPSKPSKFRDIKHLIIFAINTFANFTVNYFSRNIDKSILGWKLGSIPLGNYERAYRLFVFPVSQIADPISSVALSTLSKIVDKPQTFRDYFLKSLASLGLVGMYFSALITMSGKSIITLLLGSKWSFAGSILQAFGPAIGILFIYQTITWLFLSLGRPDVLLKWTIASTIFISGMYFLGVKFGAIGLALTYASSLYLLIIPAFYLCSKLSPIKMKDVWQNLWKYFLMFLLTIFSSFLIESFWCPKFLLVNIIYEVLLVTIIYLGAALFIFNCKNQIKQLIDILRIMLSKKFKLSGAVE